MKGRFAILYFFLLFSPGSWAQDAYPTPPDGLNRLFYIQRTGNTNTIVYDANVKGEKAFHNDDPINIYWIRYAEDGGTTGLNFLQRTFAYGVKSKKVAGTNEYEFHLVSYSKKKLRLKFDSKGKPYALLEINGKKMALQKVFVKIEKGTTFTLTPKVEYVELFGKDPNTGTAVYEKFKP
ncbi:MAG: DUF4833 domain-containing protein [Lewinellaceae bacterium]|nr:DUF4833 domain-containing protein [Saprospiraceae bacterium]MCB9353214.1 DUF4833 domain-containing protein [Lewinellaceae bacterium]